MSFTLGCEVRVDSLPEQLLSLELLLERRDLLLTLQQRGFQLL